jgi:hypothetical protein
MNPNTTYVYGKVSTEDLALFVGSTVVFAVPQITETPFKVAAGLMLELKDY